MLGARRLNARIIRSFSRKGGHVVITATVTALVALAVGPLSAYAASANTPGVMPLTGFLCGTHISLPGRYRLTSDVGPCPNDGLIIDAPGVNLNLGGHTISGSNTGAGGGIVLDASAVGSRVTNGTVMYFGTGIDDRASYSVAAATRSFFNLGIGVFVDGATGVRVLHTTVNENGRFGYYLQEAKRTLMVHDQAEFNGIYGLWIQHSSHNAVLDSGFTDNGRSGPTTLSGGGIYLGCSNHGVDPEFDCGGASNGNFLKNNVASENYGFGIAIDRSNYGNHVVSNTTLHNLGTDLIDMNPVCGTNHWVTNTFSTRNQLCIQ